MYLSSVTATGPRFLSEFAKTTDKVFCSFSSIFPLEARNVGLDLEFVLVAEQLFSSDSSLLSLLSISEGGTGGVLVDLK